MRIDYFREEEPLGTVGALALIDDLDAPFLVMNGDVLTDLSYVDLFAEHIATGAAATIASTRRTVEVTLGVMRFHDARDPDRVTDYLEKPGLAYDVSMGVYAFDPHVIGYIEPGARLDFPDLILRLLAAEEEVRAYRPDAYWLDIGRHDDYEQALMEFEAMRDRLLPHDPRPGGATPPAHSS
jgi:NDP-sugar pyrophosphorylase family protein